MVLASDSCVRRYYVCEQLRRRGTPVLVLDRFHVALVARYETVGLNSVL